MSKTLLLGILLLPTLLSFAYAETISVEIDENGFKTDSCYSKYHCDIELMKGDILRVITTTDDLFQMKLLNHNTGFETPQYGMNSEYPFINILEDNEYSVLYEDWELFVNVKPQEPEHAPTVSIETDPHENGFTGWKNEGTEMVAYKDGIRVASYEIFGANTQVPESRDNPFESVTDEIEDTTDTTILKLRIEIMKLLKGILELLVRV